MNLELRLGYHNAMYVCTLLCVTWLMFSPRYVASKVPNCMSSSTIRIILYSSWIKCSYYDICACIIVTLLNVYMVMHYNYMYIHLINMCIVCSCFYKFMQFYVKHPEAFYKWIQALYYTFRLLIFIPVVRLD